MADHVPVAAPLDSNSAGRGGAIAVNAVMRIICPQTSSQGTGFLHSSGNIITAEHVVRGCTAPVLVMPSLAQVPATVLFADRDVDIAVLAPSSPIAATPMVLAASPVLRIGAHVSTWGYPGGYQGVSPMLSAGYLGALDGLRVGSKVIHKLVVNAAFNSGNSGGPLLLIETGEVIGVVSSKLAPISATTSSILQALENQNSGMMYSGQDAAGNPVDWTEGQLIGMVLQELRQQVQLVIGYAATVDDLRSFLTSNGITP